MRVFGKRKKEHIDSLIQMTRKRSQWRDIFTRLLRNKLGVVGMVLVGALVITIVFAGVFTKYDYTAHDYSNKFAYQVGLT